MYVFVCFDIEDLVHPDADDVARDIGVALADDGVVGSMCVVGEKVRLWDRRGRTDVVAAVGQHDVGLHTDLHSVHPTVSEYLADKGWNEGVAEVMRRESPGVQDLTRILRAFPSTWGTAGSSWAPQIPAATERLGIPSNIYSLAQLPDTGASWFASQLCYTDFVSLPGGEDTCCDNNAFELSLPRLLQQIENYQRQRYECVGLFAGHPTRFRYKAFWDALNFADGHNATPDRYVSAPRRTEEDYATGLRNLRRMIGAVRALQGVHLTSLSALNGRFSPANGPVRWQDLKPISEAIVDEQGITCDDPLASPAQKLDLLARAVVRAASGQPPPPYLLLRRVLGPISSPPPLEQTLTIDQAAILVLCRNLIKHVDETGHLPSFLSANDIMVGPAPLLRGFAHLILDSNVDRASDRWTWAPNADEPAISSDLAQAVRRRLPAWPPHRSDLELERLALHTRLQSWSIKPARLASCHQETEIEPQTDAS